MEDCVAGVAPALPPCVARSRDTLQTKEERIMSLSEELQSSSAAIDLLQLRLIASSQDVSPWWQLDVFVTCSAGCGAEEPRGRPRGRSEQDEAASEVCG
jgi:hypothetical protein